MSHWSQHSWDPASSRTCQHPLNSGISNTFKKALESLVKNKYNITEDENILALPQCISSLSTERSRVDTAALFVLVNARFCFLCRFVYVEFKET